MAKFFSSVTAVRGKNDASHLGSRGPALKTQNCPDVYQKRSRVHFNATFKLLLDSPDGREGKLGRDLSYFLSLIGWVGVNRFLFGPLEERP